LKRIGADEILWIKRYLRVVELPRVAEIEPTKLEKAADD
jgi:hypothetical protein